MTTQLIFIYILYVYLYRQIEYMYYNSVLFSFWNSLSFVNIVESLIVNSM